MAGAADALAVSVGTEILKLVPGRVSTETDARLAHDTQATVEHALRLVGLYEEAGVSRERVLIKVASTWEGVRAVETLQKEGIACNCTLLFSLAQAVACAEAGATLISPFVGRILDWHVHHEGHHFEPQEDPGVAVVRRIYDYYKSHRIATTVMAASFRNVGEVRELAGVDAITLAPAILQGLAGSTEPLTRKLSPAFAARHVTDARVHAATTLPEFEAQLGHGMARDKLQEGVALFARDAAELENWLAKLKAGEAAAAQ
jgi:transaldolase